MCQDCIKEKKFKGKFWLSYTTVGFQDFQRQKEVYEKKVLGNKDGRKGTKRTIYSKDPIIVQKKEIIIYQPSDNCLIVISEKDILDVPLHTTIRGLRFWDHCLFAKLNLFGTSAHGTTFEKSEKLENLGKLINDISLGKIS